MVESAEAGGRVHLCRPNVELGQAEVEQLGSPGSDQDVGGFEIAMNHTAGVGLFEGRGNLERQFQGLVEREFLGERCALDEFHGEVVAANAVGLADVGMVELGDGACFALEALGVMGFHPHDGDGAAEPIAASFPHLARSTGADRRKGS
jgi:hypothetical protein